MAQAAIRDEVDTTVEAVLALVQPVLARRGRPAAKPEQDLREAGLTSLDLVNLMLAVEGAFDLFVPEVEMTPDNFRSAHTLAALIGRLR